MGILTLGNAALRKVCAEAVLTGKGAKSVQRIANQLFYFVQQTPAWGLSAPQIGILQRLFIMVSPSLTGAGPPLPNFGKRVEHSDLPFPAHYSAIVNPRIVSVSNEMDYDIEYCLSVPDTYVLVPRHTWIEAYFHSGDAKIRKVRLEGHAARVFQHEYDHLNGVLVIDRAQSEQDIYRTSEDPTEFNKRISNAHLRDGSAMANTPTLMVQEVDAIDAATTEEEDAELNEEYKKYIRSLYV